MIIMIHCKLCSILPRHIYNKHNQVDSWHIYNNSVRVEILEIYIFLTKKKIEQAKSISGVNLVIHVSHATIYRTLAD